MASDAATPPRARYVSSLSLFFFSFFFFFIYISVSYANLSRASAAFIRDIVDRKD